MLLDFVSEDVAILRMLIADFRNRSPKLRNTNEKFLQETQDWQASDVYVAKPTETIVAIDGTTPGSAECDIYRISDGELEEIGLGLTVYNLSDGDIEEETYIPVAKLKGGNWVALTSSPGSPNIPFIITSVASNCCYADAEIYDPHNCYTEDNTGTGTASKAIRVYDLLGCDLSGSNLIGTKGWATRRRINVSELCGTATGTGTGAETGTGTGSALADQCTSEYVIVRLCCTELL